MPRVLITACGVVSPLGSGLAENWQNLAAGFRGTGLIESFSVEGFPTRLGAEARALGNVIKTPHETDRKALFLERAADDALATGALERYPRAQRHLFLGAGIDHLDFFQFAETVATSSNWHPFCARSRGAAFRLAERHGLECSVVTNLSACVASTQAIGSAFRLLRQQPGHAVLAGGFDSMLSPLHYLGFYKLGALSTWQGPPEAACRPFDKLRAGLVIGEGAAVYVLEGEHTAQPNTVLAEIAGYATTLDAYLITDPEPSGQRLAAAAQAALDEAGLRPDDIDYVDMHGTGTRKSALSETRALELVFGRRYREIPVFALKAQVGHLIGACGALELMGVLYMLRNQCVLPTANHSDNDRDPEVPLRVVTGAPLFMPIRNVLKLNAAFGGQNTALVIRRYG